VLDRFGNVTGGIRSPFVDVPRSTWFGNSTGESFCRIAGHEVAFDSARIRQLYPEPAKYVDMVRDDVKELLGGRYITAADADELIEMARRQQ
jgi:hypothetical protein